MDYKIITEAHTDNITIMQVNQPGIETEIASLQYEDAKRLSGILNSFFLKKDFSNPASFGASVPIPRTYEEGFRDGVKDALALRGKP